MISNAFAIDRVVAFYRVIDDRGVYRYAEVQFLRKQSVAHRNVMAAFRFKIRVAVRDAVWVFVVDVWIQKPDTRTRNTVVVAHTQVRGVCEFKACRYVWY